MSVTTVIFPAVTFALTIKAPKFATAPLLILFVKFMVPALIVGTVSVLSKVAKLPAKVELIATPFAATAK